MDNATLKPHHRSTRSRSPSLSPSPSSSSLTQSLSSSRTSTRPSTSSIVRPAPARKGQPASSRNFAASSAGGASSHLSIHPTTYSNQSHRRNEPSGSGDKGRHHDGTSLNEQQLDKLEQWGDSYVPSEETIRNDYSAEYVESGQRPQNYIRNAQVETRFSEYPKLESLLSHKHALTESARYSIPPTYLDPPLSNLPVLPESESPSSSVEPPPPSSATAQAISQLVSSSARFDAILLTPPPSTTFAELSSLPLSSLASNPGFIWLWVGSGQKTFDPVTGELAGTDGGIGLEQGRELLSSWGYRRCEDIVWLKTNRENPQGDFEREVKSLFSPTIEHCLMGIRGTVRRSNDSWFVHCNVDTDVIVWEGDQEDPDLKPPELQSLIENFCLGTRRLHLYGSKNSLRRGWLTVGDGEIGRFGKGSKVQNVEKEDGKEWEPREWDREEWQKQWLEKDNYGSRSDGEGGEKVAPLLPFNEELDALRPKSPPPRNGQPSSGGLGRGRGAGLGITRSGLVTQAIPRGPPTIPSRNGDSSGAGRGRGRGIGNGNANGMANSLPHKPTHTINGFIFPNASPSSSRSHSVASSANNSPYRVHTMPPPVPQTHALPSRPSFTPQHHSSSRAAPSHSSQPQPQPQRYNHGPPPLGYSATPSGGPSHPREQYQYNGGFASSQYQSHPQGPPQHYQPQTVYPSPEQLYHAQQFQQYQVAYPYGPGAPSAQSSYGAPLHAQFSNLSLSHGHSYPTSPIPPPPNPIVQASQPSPSLAHNNTHYTAPPHPGLASSFPSNPYLFPPPVPPPAPLSSSVSSSSSMSFSQGYGNGKMEYPIGGPSSSTSHSRRTSQNYL
ncbi:hypothetical protein JCM16303_005777 [Sporobolomyces ruberrimus]